MNSVSSFPLKPRNRSSPAFNGRFLGLWQLIIGKLQPVEHVKNNTNVLHVVERHGSAEVSDRIVPHLVIATLKIIRRGG